MCETDLFVAEFTYLWASVAATIGAVPGSAYGDSVELAAVELAAA